MNLLPPAKDNEAHCRMLNPWMNRPALERHLLPLAIAVSETLAKYAEEPVKQASHFNNLSLSLAKSGDRTAELKAILRAVEIYE